MFTKGARVDIILLISVFFVAIAGIVTLYTQEMILAEGTGRWWKQLIWFGLGLIICFVIMQSNYQLFGTYALPAYAVILLLLIVTLIFAPRINGAKSWLKIGPIGFQASEFAKLITIILMAKYLEIKEKEMGHMLSLFVPSLIAIVPMMLIVIQPDFGGAFSFAPVLLSMLFIAGADIYYISSILIFFGISFSIPLYIEYHKITLLTPLIDHLDKIGKVDLIPTVKILQKDVWEYISSGTLSNKVATVDQGYLNRILSNESLVQTLKQAASSVQSEEAGILLLFLQNIELLVVISIILITTSVILLSVRYARGSGFEKLRKVYIPLGVLGVSILAATTFHTVYSFKYHQVLRILAFVNPEKFPRNHSYQIIASKTAIGSGKLTGKGLYHGEMTIGNRPLVPEAFTDFIFSSWSERVGFIGAVLLVIALLAIPLRALQLSYESRDRFGALLASGISFLLFYHISINVCIALGLLPVTGIPLSFMSYGGSHMIMCMTSIGILLSIYRRKFANQ